MTTKSNATISDQAPAVRPGHSLANLIAEASFIEQQIIEFAETNGGEINPHLEKFLDGIKTQVGTKTDNYKFIMDRMDMASELLNQRADEFYRAAKSLDNMKDAMKFRIKEAMVAMKVDEVKGETWRFKLQNNPASLVVDEIALKASEGFAEKYEIVETIRKIDTAKIKSELQAGGTVPGCILTVGQHVRPYVNKNTK